MSLFFFFFQAEDGIRDLTVTGVQTCALPISRYTDPVCRLCRREGMKLFLKGDRCFKDKCAIERRNYAPGQDRKSTRLNSSHSQISYAVFCLKKKKKKQTPLFFSVSSYITFNT